MNQHNPNIDAMRVIAAFAVVWLHVSVWVVYGDPSVASSGWWAGNLVDSFTRWSVPLFVMLSGMLLLSAPASPSPLDFWRKRLHRLLPALVLWTLVYFAFRYFFEPPFGWKDALKSLLKGNAYYHTWYLYMLVGLTFITPYLRQLVALLSRRALLYLILGSFIIAAGEFAYGGRIMTFLPSFLPFVGYFLAGHYLAALDFTPKKRLFIPLFLLCGLAIALSTAALLPRRDVQAYDLTYSYHNLLVVGMSLSVFLLLIKAPPLTGFWQRIAPITLGVYAIHPLWMWALGRLGVDGFWLHPAIGIPVTATLAFILSVLSAALLARIPLLKRVVC
jgi:surface polysaccharide O-acyltransferase-like enzyme